MKQLAAVASLFVTATLSTAAFAQPSLMAPIAPTDAPASEPTHFLSLGLSVGVSDLDTGDDLVYRAATFEGGYRLGLSPLWLHGQVSIGGLAQVLTTAVDTGFADGRVGIETRACVADGVLCAIGGVDLGVRYQTFTGNDGWGGTTTDNTNTTTVQSAGFEVVPRGGLDIGGDHIRVRPTAELAFGAGNDAAAVSCAVAYLW